MSTFNENLETLLNGDGPQGEMLTAAPTTDEWIAQHAWVLYYLNLHLCGQLGNYMSPDSEPLATWIAGEPWSSTGEMAAAGHAAMWP